MKLKNTLTSKYLHLSNAYQTRSRITKCYGVTLIELVVTITIASIMFVGYAAFMNTSFTIINQAVISNTTNNNTRVALNILTQDLLSNTGNVNIVTTSTSNTLNFNIPDPDNSSANRSIYYVCDYNTHQFYRQLDLATPEILIEQINSCAFATAVSSNSLNITLFTKINLTEQDSTNTIYEVINAPYTA